MAIGAADNTEPDFDLELRTSSRDDAPVVADWPLSQENRLKRRGEEAPRIPAPNLPLFTQPSASDDEPLIKLPVTPRPPLAVRRAPETPRLHMVSRVPRPAEVAPALQFEDAARDLTDPGPTRTADDSADERPTEAPSPAVNPPGARHRGSKARPAEFKPSSPASRAAAAAIDFVLLGAVDVTVVYFTLRVAGLGTGDWNLLPVAPLAVFLVLLKLAYFCAFTAVGGQTIGKMALHIRVVTDGLVQPDATVALRRTLIGAASGACLGFGFVPAFFDPEGRTFHDRITRTRVVTLRTA